MRRSVVDLDPAGSAVSAASAGAPPAGIVAPSRPADSTVPVPVARCGTPASGAPHSPQNFMPGGFWKPQTGHPFARRVPHSPQNFMPGGFWRPQAGQVTYASSGQ